MALKPNSLLEDHPAGETGDVNTIVNGNWTTINNYINPGAGLTARLDDGTPPGSGNVITASGDVFLGSDAGATIFFETDRENYTILSVTNATTALVVGSGGELSAQSFQLFRTTETARTALARGLVKQTRIESAQDAMILRWNHSLLRFDLQNIPGYNVALGRVLYGGGASTDLASSADFTFDDSTDILTVNGFALTKAFRLTHATISSAASIGIDFALNQLRSINPLSADVTFSTSNLAAGRQQILRIVCDGTLRNFTWPGSWVWLGSAPASIAANKTGLLTLIAFGTSDSDVVAKWEVEP